MLGRGQTGNALLARMADDMSAMRADLASMSGRLGVIEQRTTDADAARQDHEGRLRALERWRYALPVSAIGTIAAVAIEVVSHVH